MKGGKDKMTKEIMGICEIKKVLREREKGRGDSCEKGRKEKVRDGDRDRVERKCGR